MIATVSRFQYRSLRLPLDLPAGRLGRRREAARGYTGERALQHQTRERVSVGENAKRVQEALGDLVGAAKEVCSR